MHISPLRSSRVRSGASRLGVAVLAVAAVSLLDTRLAAGQDFQWHGAIAQGRAIEIKGVNGDVRAEPSGSNEVEVVAVKRAVQDDPASVRIDVVQHAGGVTAGLTLVGKTVNGEVEATRLNGDVALSTVNGSVTFSTTGGGRASTV